MAQGRLEALLGFVQKNPKDLFARFGLAMEYAKAGETEKALEHFRTLWEMNPDYTAAYFQAGKLLSNAGEKEKARDILAQGIQAAIRTADLHTKSEMEAVMAEL